MEALDGMDLTARMSSVAKEYWVHLDAEGSFEKYPAKQHARRVQEKLGIDEGLIYLAGQPARNNEDSDMPAPFRQRRYFYYLTGCNEPSCHMTYDIQHDTLALFIRRIDPKRVIWNGRGSTLAEALERYDIDEVYYVDELGDVIKEWSSDYGGHGSDIFVLHDGQLPPIPALHATIDSETLQPAMNAARMIKDEHEISLIRKANKISSEAHKKVLANILKFKNEAQVEGLFMDVCISHQAKEQAYDPIAASGPNAGTLHYDANNEDFEDRQLMCLDAGCEYELYASDITRTFPLAESWPSAEAENIYKLVERMQESCIERLAPGVRYLDLHILAHQIAIDGLLKLGILHNGTREEIYAAGTSKAFFPHGLGHHVGLEVHDVGQAELMSVRRGKAVRQQVPSLFPQEFHMPVFDPALCHAPTDAQSSQLEEGMVVTVEPGIYFSLYALQHFYLPSPVHSRFINKTVLNRYMAVGGVRIEDDILITSKGYENLTTAPKGDAMFDVIRGRRSKTHLKEGLCGMAQKNEIEPYLFRAPGCPPRTMPFRPQQPKRASTAPHDNVQEQQNSIDRRNHALNFRRSMTTDERVQHWQRSQPQQSLGRFSDSHEYSQTICGSPSRFVKHITMGDSQSHSSQTSQLADCADCAILAQTLCRLRQNLAATKQGSGVDAQQVRDLLSSPVRDLPVPQAADPIQHSRVERANARPRPIHTARHHNNSDDSHNDRQSSSALKQPCLTRMPEPGTNYATPSLHAHMIHTPNRVSFDDPGSAPHKRLDQLDPEDYYRGHELVAPSSTVRRESGWQNSQATDQRSSRFRGYRALETHKSMPLSTPLAHREQRRLSDHTDDRDWMA